MYTIACICIQTHEGCQAFFSLKVAVYTGSYTCADAAAAAAAYNEWSPAWLLPLPTCNYCIITHFIILILYLIKPKIYL